MNTMEFVNMAEKFTTKNINMVNMTEIFILSCEHPFIGIINIPKSGSLLKVTFYIKFLAPPPPVNAAMQVFYKKTRSFSHFFIDFRREITEKVWNEQKMLKTAEKKYFDQL